MEDGTYNRNKERITYPTGYQVGLWTESFKDRSEMDNIFSMVLDKTQNSEFGVWTEDDIFFIEPCVWISNLEDAFSIGKALNQKSVWCWTTMRAIYIE